MPTKKGQKRRKQFLFEKKNQKAFDYCPPLRGQACGTGAARNE
jgi:hypothetical protein